MSVLQELVTKYTFDVDSKALDKVNEKVDGLIAYSAKLAAAGTAAAIAVFGMAKMTATAGDEALATAQKLGISVENLTRFQFAAKLSNVDAGNFNIALRFMSKNLDDASKGTGTAFDAFKKLRVGIKDAHGQLIPTDKLLLSLSEKFKKLPDGAVKTALAMDIFGRSGADMIPMLNEGASGLEKMMKRSDELGFTMSTELAKAGDEFNDTLDELLMGLTGLRNLVGSQLIPVLLPLIKKITEFMIANRKLIATRLEIFFKQLATFAKGVWIIFEALYKVVSGLVTVFGGFENTLKLITAAVLIFAGAKMLIMIGQLALAVYELGGSFLFAEASALALPLAIGALIAIVGLLAEDIYTYFTDDNADTMFGSLIGGVKKAYTALDEFFGSMGKWGQALVNYLLFPIRALISAFKVVEKLWNFDPTSKQGWKDLASDLAGIGTQAILGGGTIGEAIGVTPTSDSAVTSRQERNYFNAQPSIVNQITVGENADVAGIGKILTQGTKDGIDQSLRGAQRSVGKKGAY